MRWIVKRAISGGDPIPPAFSEARKLFIPLGRVAKTLNSGELWGKYCIEGS
jgi:hypothetical protein